MSRSHRSCRAVLGLERLEERTVPAGFNLVPQTFAVGTTPVAVALGDFNGDKKLDAVTANNGSNNVSVLLGNGDGTFQPAKNFAVGSGPTTVALGDLLGNGKLDIVTGNRDGTVSVLLGNGDGTFQAVHSFTTSFSIVNFLALGNVSGAGTPDIITSNGSAVTVLLGNGNGSFQVGPSTVLNTPATSLAVGDVNGDGKLDIVTGGGLGTVSVLLGNGDGSFQSADTFAVGSGVGGAGINGNGSAVTAIALGDMTGDGKLDIVTTNEWDTFLINSVSVLRGNGDGTFQTAQVVDGLPFSVNRQMTLTDINGDGKLDVVEMSAGTVGVLLGNGDGTLQTARTFSTGLSTVNAVAFGDLNNDGNLDIVAASSSTNNVSVALGSGFRIDELGAYRPSNGSWSLDSDGTPGFNPATDQVFLNFSPPGVTGVAGDWTGNGTTDIGDFSNGVWHLDLNGNGVVDPGETFQFGQAGDQPVVGDWDGNPSGRDELGVFRAAPDGITGEFILDIANHHAMDSSNLVFTFGYASDHVIVGDWTGDGVTKVGVYRDAASYIAADAGDTVFSLDAGNHHTFDFSSQVFVFGLITDKVVIGDWIGGGISKVGVYRDGAAFGAPGTALFSLDSGTRMYLPGITQVLLYGLDSDQFVSGHWKKTPPLQPS